MIIFHETEAPSGALLRFHKLASLVIRDNIATATVNSYANSAMTAIVSQVDHDVPMHIFTGDPFAKTGEWLVSHSGPHNEGVAVAEHEANLEQARAIKLAEVKILRDRHEWAGVASPFGRIETDPNSQRKLSGAVAMSLVLGDAFSMEWRMADDTVITLDKITVQSAGVLAGAHVSACQNVKNIYDARIRAAVSPEEIAGIDLSYGWPECEPFPVVPSQEPAPEPEPEPEPEPTEG